jgi:hypothetical protein
MNSQHYSRKAITIPFVQTAWDSTRLEQTSFGIQEFTWQDEYRQRVGFEKYRLELISWAGIDNLHDSIR